MDIRLVAADLL